MEQLKQPSPSTNPTTHPMAVSLSCWSSAPRTLSLPCIARDETELLTRRVVEDPPGFPAYSRLRTASSPMRGAAPPACLGASYLRTVIVHVGPHVAMRRGPYLHPCASTGSPAYGL